MRYALVLILITFLFGCGTKKESAHDHAAHSEKQSSMHKEQAPADDAVVIRKPTEKELGTVATCPVMGTEFKVTKSRGTAADYNGKTYYLCCDGCIEPFKNDPKKYIK